MLPKLKSIFSWKCPRCLKGDLFPEPNAYKLKHTAEMHASCPNCGLNYEPEPGFYYGSMYVSYALTIAIGVGLFLIDYLFFWNRGVWFYIILLSTILLLLAPLTFRTSRAIWLNFFIRYRP